MPARGTQSEHPTTTSESIELPKDPIARGQFIASARRARGQSQAKFAEHVLMELETLQKIERGGGSPRQTTLERIALTLKRFPVTTK